MSSQSTTVKPAEHMGHPRGLAMIFFTEMWERFGYYGMRALLVLYMTKAFVFSDDKAYGIYGAFTAFVYITPIFGGILADRVLGFRMATIMGTITMALGYTILALSDGMTNMPLTLFYCSLAIIAIGNGLFKPNTSSLVGTLYEAGDNRRDAGYTIFYMGINTGSILAPIVCGYVGEVYGWFYGFMLTTVGLILGLIIFMSYQHQLGDKGLPPQENSLYKKRLFGLNAYALTAIGILVTTPIIAYMLTGTLTGYLLNLTGLITLGYIIRIAVTSQRDERNKIFALLIMMFFYACFFACFEQAGSSINLFTDRNVDRLFELTTPFFHIHTVIPATVFQAVNPIFIVMFAPIVASVWGWLGKANIEPSTPTKFAIGFLLASLGFFIYAESGNFANSAGLTSMNWLLGGYLFLTLGELAISPVGLAMISRYAPQRMLGLLMGALMLSIAFGNYIAAVLAKLASAPEHIMSGEQSGLYTLSIYTAAFKQIAWFALAVAVLLVLCTPLINRLVGEEQVDVDGKTTKAPELEDDELVPATQKD